MRQRSRSELEAWRTRSCRWIQRDGGHWYHVESFTGTIRHILSAIGVTHDACLECCLPRLTYVAGSRGLSQLEIAK